MFFFILIVILILIPNSANLIPTDREITPKLQNSGAVARAARIFSASTIASIRRKSSGMVELIKR